MKKRSNKTDEENDFGLLDWLIEHDLLVTIVVTIITTLVASPLISLLLSK